MVIPRPLGEVFAEKCTQVRVLSAAQAGEVDWQSTRSKADSIANRPVVRNDY